jgi:hypothetical protein
MSTSTRIDTAEMPAVHRLFRREFSLAAGVVRGVRAGDVARARTVARHLDYIARCLHDHHTAEDELAWPLLLQRVPDELAPMVHLMEGQHERVDGLLTEIERIRPALGDDGGSRRTRPHGRPARRPLRRPRRAPRRGGGTAPADRGTKASGPTSPDAAQRTAPGWGPCAGLSSGRSPGCMASDA